MARTPLIAWWLVALVAALELVSMDMEMFRWTYTAQHVARFGEELADSVKVLGWNQGLYNGFLAAGLI